jgi:DNA-binding NarL/FixJ family response regulator
MAWRRLAPIEPKPELKLTARETQVLHCFAEGLGTDAIASRLSISRTTVRNHAQRILAKLDVHTRLAAVARGYTTGLLTIPSRA